MKKQVKVLVLSKIVQLAENDFDKIDFTILNRLLRKYYQDENWGTDLEIFKSNTLKAFCASLEIVF